MRIALILLLGLSACGPDDTTGPTWRDKPPARFQGNTSAAVVFTDAAMIARACPSTPNPVACTRGRTIYMPNACAWSDPYAVLLCHEIGHVNSWPADHPQ